VTCKHATSSHLHNDGSTLGDGFPWPTGPTTVENNMGILNRDEPGSYVRDDYLLVDGIVSVLTSPHLAGVIPITFEVTP
jgi:hypothetical protein